MDFIQVIFCTFLVKYIIYYKKKIQTTSEIHFFRYKSKLFDMLAWIKMTGHKCSKYIATLDYKKMPIGSLVYMPFAYHSRVFFWMNGLIEND